MNNNAKCTPVGIFDSGVGGLSVLKAIRQEVPSRPLVYLADQANVPYGARSLEEVKRFSEEITRFLTNLGINLVVVACNTASAAALHSLRATFPDISFVGMEPAVKPAALSTFSGKVGVLATPATFQGKLYASVVERFGKGIKIYQNTCPGLVQQIEKGDLDGPSTRRILDHALTPMLKNGVDVIVLGCTHYPFVAPLIQTIAGPDVKVIDPAPAVARQVSRLIDENEKVDREVKKNSITFYTSGEPQCLADFLTLINEEGSMQSLTWQEGRLW
jgi:glutamate racemase